VLVVSPAGTRHSKLRRENAPGPSPKYRWKRRRRDSGSSWHATRSPRASGDRPRA